MVLVRNPTSPSEVSGSLAAALLRGMERSSAEMEPFAAKTWEIGQSSERLAGAATTAPGPIDVIRNAAGCN